MEQATSLTRSQWLESTVNGLGDGWTVLRAVRDGDRVSDYIIIDANELVRRRWSTVVGDIIGSRLGELPGIRENEELFHAYEEAVLTQKRKIIDFQIPLAGLAGGWRRATIIPLDTDTIAIIAADIDRERYFEDAAEQERTWLSRLASGEQSSAFASGPASQALSMKISAAMLFIAAGAVTMINSAVNHPAGVDLWWLRIAALATTAVGVFILFLPWERHPRRVAQSVVLLALVLLGGFDRLDHYAHAQAALAIYPVFFIMTVAWSGLYLGRGAATATAALSVPVMTWMFASAGHGNTGV